MKLIKERIGKSIEVEIKNGICNWRLWGAAVVLICAALASVQEEFYSLLVLGQSPEGPGWFTAFQFLINNSTTLMFIPFLAPLASASTAEEEIKSRYSLFVCIRSGKKPYFAGKIFAMIFTGD